MKTFGQIAGARLPRRVTARLAGMGTAPGALVWQPAPPTTGDPAAARRLARGVLLFDGRLVETLEAHPWDLTPPDRIWEAALHGHGWLDDAALAEEPGHRAHLAEWAWTWLDRYGTGTGPGWEPEVAARRLTRWIAHSVMLLNGQPPERSAALFRALGMQARYVDWRWRETRDGAGRIEALAGRVYAHVSLEGQGRETERAIADLGREAGRIIDPEGGIASRSPEELAHIVAILTWAQGTIEDAGLTPAPAHVAAIRRAEPVVVALRHPSGALARFHGGRPGVDLAPEDRDRLAAGRPPVESVSPMGYCRLICGPSYLVLDGAPPPTGPHAMTAHASPLAFELSHNGHPVVVNAGSGHGFGIRTAHAARRISAHSGIELGERCPGRLVPVRDTAEAKLTAEGTVSARLSRDPSGTWLLGESTLYESWFGLRVERRLHLSADGMKLSGEETALATRADTRAQVARSFPDGGEPCRMVLRLHLAPEVTARPALNGRAVSLHLADGNQWVFIADADELELADSTYYDETRPKPRATKAIIARAPVLEYWGRMTWSLERLPQGATPLKSGDRP